MGDVVVFLGRLVVLGYFGARYSEGGSGGWGGVVCGEDIFVEIRFFTYFVLVGRVGFGVYRGSFGVLGNSVFFTWVGYFILKY